MRVLKLILDDGSPNCLPAWARDEIVRRRLEWGEMREEIAQLRIELAVAKGNSLKDALMKEWLRSMDKISEGKP